MRQKVVRYNIEGESEGFNTLRDAKYHIWFAYTPNERIKYFGKDLCYICGINKDEEVVSLTEIRVDDSGRESFGKTQRL